MKLRPMRFDFYLGRAVFTTVLLTWAVLTGLDVVMAFSG
ncbi:MAG TPA: LPS export ABC transporter permease LptG, partial [Stenotrophomonas sp.]|nr:LPS export ABC transporter permease LptG [Stenotrophomonas sp.]